MNVIELFKAYGFIKILFAVLFVQIAAGLLIFLLFPCWETRGQFGDMFGSVNALFSGLAFAVVCVTIIFQQAQIKDQNRQIEEQKEAFYTQSFENTLFQMLKLHNEILENISVETNKGVFETGRTALITLLKRIKSALENPPKDLSPDDMLKFVSNHYSPICLRAESDLGHYFRNLYHIIKHIDESNIVNKKKYTSLVRAQISGREHILLFFNCLSSVGREKFKPLIERYALLENMPKAPFMAPYRSLYHIDAYGT